MINYKAIEVIHQSEQNSTVLKVKNIDTNEICALKIIGQLSNKLTKLIFKREVTALRELNQFDDIVKIYDFSDSLHYRKESGNGGILLEFINGKPFYSVNFSEFSDLDKIVICRNVATAILHAHQCGILHRDIKTSNIMLVHGGTEIKVIDFGSSKLKAIVDEETSQRIFSVGYVAPEVAQGHEATEKSDIYSLGAVFYYVLFSNETMPEKVQSKVENAALLPEMRSLILRMIATNPEERIESVQEVVDILVKIIGDLNDSTFNYLFQIDSDKMVALKREYLVEDILIYPQFLSIYLPREFYTMYGIYNEEKNLYEFVGNNLYMLCSYDEQQRLFYVVKIYEISIDKKAKLQRIFGLVEGRKEFSGYNSKLSGKNNNNRLVVQLRNFAKQRKSIESKNIVFEEIFGQWRQSINESLNTIKNRSLRVEYSDFWREQDKLFLCLKNRSLLDVDALSQETHFIFDILENERERSVSIGYFEDFYCEDNKDVLVLLLDRGVSDVKLELLLEKQTVILEDYNRRNSAYRKQLLTHQINTRHF